VKKEDDEITFDFSRIAKIFRKDSNDSKSAGDKKPAEEEELTLDFKKAGSFLYKYRMVFLLLIPLILGF